MNPTDWREALKADLCAWVDALPDEAGHDADNAQDDIEASIDLQSVWSAIIGLESHTRHQAQKMTAALHNLSQAVQAQTDAVQAPSSASDQTASDPGPMPHMVAALAAMAAQLQRLVQAFDSPPKPVPFGLGRQWQNQWQLLAESTAILQRQLHGLLPQLGIEARWPQPDALFDPLWMEAVEILPGHGKAHATVQSVFEPAFFVNDRCIRAAKTSISR